MSAKKNHFNDYFVSFGENMANKIQQPTFSCAFTEISLFNSSLNSFFLSQFDPAKKNNSGSPPNKYIKLAASKIAPTFLFKQCILTSTFPNSLKMSEIKPLFKQRSKHNCTDYAGWGKSSRTN